MLSDEEHAADCQNKSLFNGMRPACSIYLQPTDFRDAICRTVLSPRRFLNPGANATKCNLVSHSVSHTFVTNMFIIKHTYTTSLFVPCTIDNNKFILTFWI